MNNFKISIVVPIYNVENYLNKCINSLLEQTYKKIEIILVNDGSTDSSSTICEKYKIYDNRIKIVHKKNGGLSDARNIGIEKSEGDYILFVDSDDYIDKDSCEKFINILKNKTADIITGNARKIQNKISSLIQYSQSEFSLSMSGEKFLKKELKNGTMHMAVWLNLYKREFLINKNLKFKKGLLHEDEEFTPRAFLKATSVISTKILFYNYVVRTNSITTTKNLEKNAYDILKICTELHKIYILVEDKELNQLLRDNLVTKYLYAFQIGKFYKKKYQGFLDEKFLLENSYSRKNIYKVNIFCFNKKIYYLINKLYKLIRG